MTYDNWLSSQTDRFYVSCEPEPDKDGEFTKCLNCENKCDDFLEIIGKEKNDNNQKFKGIQLQQK